jgi:AmiR/NasT family two-component response regulator
VERAKGVLMREEHLSEEAAFRKIQKKAMDLRKSMREIAEAIVLAKKIRE